MHYAKTIEKIQSLLSSSKLVQLMKANETKLEVFPATVVEHRKKNILNQIEAASDQMYPYHTACAKPVREYCNSIILAGNDVVVPHMIQEAIDYAKSLVDFQNHQTHLAVPNGDKVITDIQPLMAYYKGLKFKTQDVLSALLDDLTMLSQRDGFEFNKRDVADAFNNSIAKNQQKPHVQETEVLIGGAI